MAFLVLLVFFAVFGYFTWKKLRNSGHRRRPPPARHEVCATAEADHTQRWTTLDDHQLDRLLKDSSP